MEPLFNYRSITNYCSSCWKSYHKSFISFFKGFLSDLLYLHDDNIGPNARFKIEVEQEINGSSCLVEMGGGRTVTF